MVSAVSMLSAIRASVTAACGVTGNLFRGPGRLFDAELTVDLDAVVPRPHPGGLYSSLWLYLAGMRPVVFGARVGNGEPAPGDRVDLLLANAVSRFHVVGGLRLGEETDDAPPRFASSNCGGGLIALPPARAYAG